MSAAANDASQRGFAYRFDWGLDGLRALAPSCDVVVIVDVLRFTSAVTAAVEAGAVVYPFAWNDDRAAHAAAGLGAEVAGRRGTGGPSLSPTDLLAMPHGKRIVLPSPNGSTIAAAAVELEVAFVLAGSLRNATATARRAAALAHGGAIAIIAAGERWGSAEGPLRPSFEDLIGAGAVLAALDPSGAATAPMCSPEASAARAAFQNARPLLADTVANCVSGRELCARGWDDDVAAASQLDVTPLAAQMIDGAFIGV